MNHLQYYLMKLGEEGTEVAHIAQKTIQFGPNEVMEGQPLTNFERLHLELDDLHAMIQVLNEKFNLKYVPSEVNIANKKAKVEKFLRYSIKLGMIDPLPEQPKKSIDFGLKDGSYSAIAGGYQSVVRSTGTTYTFQFKKGIRGFGIPDIITIIDDKIMSNVLGDSGIISGVVPDKHAKNILLCSS